MISKDMIHIFPGKKDLAQQLAKDFVQYTELMLEKKDLVYIAISGGNTPKLLFSYLSEEGRSVPWEKVRIFWVDERCVPPDHIESNYNHAKSLLLDPLNIPDKSVFRMRGEDDPEQEAKRYAGEILKNVTPDLSFPTFDLVFLGLGEDGHTASIFPDQLHLWQSNSICEVAENPQSGQKRITLTGPVINAANRIIFHVTGESKSSIVIRILKELDDYIRYPAAYVKPLRGVPEWYLDADASRDLINHED